MCKAIDDMRNASREEGIKEGREEGREETLLTAIKSVMERFKMNARQAMEVLQVPVGDQDWITENNVKYKDISYIFLEKQNWITKVLNFILRKLNKKEISQ